MMHFNVYSCNIINQVTYQYLYCEPSKRQKACVLMEHTLVDLGELPQLRDALDLASWLDVQMVLYH